MEYKELAINLAHQAGEIIRRDFTLAIQKEWKEDESPVTATDKKVNELVINQIREKFPTHSIMAEEGNHLTDRSEYIWICDPLSGTYNFAHHVPISTFSLALLKNGISILGVIQDPFSKNTFYAEQNKGAYLNGQAIKVSEANQIKKQVIEISIPLTAKFDLWDLFGTLGRQKARVLKLGSVTYSGSFVASGEFIAMIYGNEDAHDIAALKVIVEEAGGKVTDLFGNEQIYDQPIKGAIVSNGKVHDLLVKEVSKVIQANSTSES